VTLAVLFELWDELEARGAVVHRVAVTGPSDPRIGPMCAAERERLRAIRPVTDVTFNCPLLTVRSRANAQA
jgi:hypothetical protein